MVYAVLDTAGDPLEGSSLEIARIVAGDLDRTTLRDLVMISLFTWRRAEDGDDVPDGASRRGWWGDDTLGSRLWLLGRRKITAETLSDARAYAEEGLAWLVEEGIAESVDVSVVRAGVEAVITVTIHRPGLDPDVVRFDRLWSALYA